MLVTTTASIRRVLDEVRAGTIVEALGRRGALAEAAGTGHPDAAAQLLREAIADGSDEVTSIVAVHALAALGDNGSQTLVALVRDGEPFLREHAVWALGGAPVALAAVPALAELVAAGGFCGTLAQRTLETWAMQEPDSLCAAMVTSLRDQRAEDPRARLVETLGLVPGTAAISVLRALAGDEREAPASRAAALAALGDGADPADQDVRSTLDAVAGSGGRLARVAQLAVGDLDGGGSASDGAAGRRGQGGEGLTVAQLFLHADIDGRLLHAGQGDTGGIATLLVHLGDALLVGPGTVRTVVTISRGAPGEAVPGGPLDAPGHHYVPVPLWGPPVRAADAWPLRVGVRRAIRRTLRRAQVQVLHLRMADVASWAAAEAARDLGIPVVMTMAPDPHAMVASREADGSLTRAAFGAVDRVEHLMFRVALLRELQEQAAHLVMFPRPNLLADTRQLLGLDLELEPHRATVVPEGIDLAPLDRAAWDVRAASLGENPSTASAAALGALDAMLDSLPSHRRGLPLALTVGRLHRVKGMAPLVDAWEGRPELSDRCNLLVIGGDLDHPTDDEREQLDLIDATVERAAGPHRGLLLAGHHPNATVATWLAAARYGRPGRCAPAGVYVSASLKEEFGIAILEAMASGLVVVAPRAGGPATYVEHGVTGVLVDTGSKAALADAVVAALDLAEGPEAHDRAERARRVVRDRFSIGTMAAALITVYREVSL